MLSLTRAQLREVDRRSIEDYGIPGIVLMENASRALADVVMAELSHAAEPSVLILAGGGNNGGDGLAAARHLHNRGVLAQIAIYGDSAKYKGDAAINWQIVFAMKLPTFAATPESIRACSATLIVDAILGTGLSDVPRGEFGGIVAAIEATRLPVIAVDIPSGLDCDTGIPLGACVRATRTVTFAAMKTGFANHVSKAFTGDVTVADIGCPRELLELVRQV